MYTWYGQIIGVNRIKAKGVPTTKANVLILVSAIEPEGQPCSGVEEHDLEEGESFPDTLFEIIGVVDANDCLVISDIKVPVSKAVNSHLSLKTRTREVYTKNTKAGFVRRTAPNGRIMHYFNGQAVLNSWAIEVEESWSLPEYELEEQAVAA